MGVVSARPAVLLLAALFADACGGSTPRPDFERFDPAVTPTGADYPDVPAVVLLDRGTLQLTVDAVTRNPLAKLTRLHRYKILRDASWIDVKHVVIPYDPGSVVAGLLVRKISPEGRIEEIDEKNFADGAHESGRRALTVSIPGAVPGTIVEYTYDLYIPDPRFVPPWLFQSSLPTVRSEYAVQAPRGFQVDLRFSRDGAFVDRTPERFDTDGGTRYFWSEANLPARFQEPGMPSPELLSPRAHVIFMGANVGGADRPGFASWEDVGAWFVARVPNWTKLEPATIAEAKRLAGETSTEEKALKLLSIVARDLGWEPGPQLPLWQTRVVHPEIVLKEKRGNATSRGLLLVALLRAVGISAIPALVAYRDHGVLLPDLPTVYELDGVVAVIPRNQGPLILDPSQLTVSADVPPPRLQGARIVALREDGAEVMLVPTSNPSDSRTSLSYDLKLDVRGDLFGTMEARLTGSEAGLLRQQLLEADVGAYADIVSQFIKERGGGIAIESASIADLSELRRPLGVKGTVSVRKAVSGDGTSLALALGKIVGSDDHQVESRLREVRRAPLRAGAPREVEIVATISMPEDYEPEQLLPAFTEKWEGGEVSIKMRSEGTRRIGIVRKGAVRVLEVKPQQYADYRRFRRAVVAAEERSFTIKRPPPRTLEY
jgi:uncharacterized protein DUF3857